MKIDYLQLMPYAVVIAFTLLPLLWYHPGQIISGGDLHYPIFAYDDFFSRTFVWNIVFLSGTDRAMDMTVLPFSAITYVLSCIGLPPEAAQIVFLMILCLSIALSILFLANKLFKNPYAIFMSVFLYCFSYYQFYNFEIVRIGEISATILLPILLGVSHEIAASKNISPKTFAILFFACFYCGGVGIQPPVLIITFMTCAFFCLYRLYMKRLEGIESVIQTSIKLSIIPLIFIIANVYWLAPVLSYTLDADYTSTSKSIEVFGVFELLKWTSAHSSFINIFQFLPRTVWFSSWANYPYYPTMISLHDSLVANVGFVIILFSFFVLLGNKTKKPDYSNTLFFSLTTLISMFFCKGSHEPFGAAYNWAITNIPLFWIYRAPYEKFGLLYVLSIAILAGYSTKYLYESAANQRALSNQRIKNWFTFTIVTMVILNSLFVIPLISGKMIPSSEGEYGYHEHFNLGYYQKYPDYIYNASSWIRNQNSIFNILLLPDQKSNAYNWGYGSATDISIYFFNKGLIFRQYGEGTAPPSSTDDIYNLVQKQIYTGKNTNVFKLLEKMNVRYILQRNDFFYDFYGSETGNYLPSQGDSPQFIKKIISDQNNILMARSFGEWDFYELPKLQPIIRKANLLVSINSTKEINDYLLLCDNAPHPNDFFFETEIENATREFKTIIEKNTGYRLEKKDIEYRKVDFDSGLREFDIKYDSRYDTLASIISDEDNRFLHLENKGYSSYIFLESQYEPTPLHPFEFEFAYRMPGIDSNSSAFFTDINWTDENNKSYRITYQFALETNKAIIERAESTEMRVYKKIKIGPEQDWKQFTAYPIEEVYSKYNISYTNAIPTKISVTMESWTDSNLTVDLDNITSKNIIGNDCRFNKEVYVKNQSLPLTKINPTKYTVTVNEIDEKFILATSIPFNENWKIFIEPKTYDFMENNTDFKHDIFDLKYAFIPNHQTEHFRINGYANAWNINRAEICNQFNQIEDCKFTITIFYKPQAFFYVGLIILVVTLIIVAFTVLSIYRKQNANFE